MTLELVPLCTIDLELGEQLLVGEGPAGMRVVVEVKAGKVSGERLNGTVRTSSVADWLVVNGTVGSPDVRATIETADGALIYATYTGRMDLTNGPGSAPIYTTPRFEAGDERYAWLNVIQAVAKGELDGHSLTYDVYELR